jgi:hypothetical protein
MNLKDALKILQSTFDEYEPKPTLDTIVSPYSRENETFFRFKVMESYARETKFTCKLCKANIDQPLMRLRVAKHIFSGEVLADVCGFCGTYCKTSLGLKLTPGTKNNGTYKAQSNCTHDYDFSIASCLKLSDNNPCSNRPVKCELCENAVVWSYGLNLHYSLLHQVPLM